MHAMRATPFALVIALASAASAVATLSPEARAADTKKREVTFSLAVHVARESGAAVQSDAWIDAQIARAEELFGPVGVHFKRAATKPLPAAFLHLETRADRDGLAAELEKGRINVMIVGSLRDVDTPVLLRQGVHWRPAASPAKHFVVVASTAGTTVLAHELGHFFGNPHTAIKDNLMSYDRSGSDVFLTEEQKKKSVIFAGIYTRSKELLAE